MAARAMWKGVIQLDGDSLPVKLYSAVQDRTVHFNIVDDRTMQRVKQRMVNPDTNEEVPSAEIKKGFQSAPGEYVIIEDQELEALRPPASRDIVVTRFVKPATLAPQWYSRPYYLGPDQSDRHYFALAKAMAEEELEGLAHWTMRNKRYLGTLRTEGDYLMLITLRYADEVLAAKDLPAPEGKTLDEREVKMAQQLVEALAGDFDPRQFKDEYRHRVQELVEAKAAGHTPKLKAIPKKKPTESLTDALQASIKAARKRSAA